MNSIITFRFVELQGKAFYGLVSFSIPYCVPKHNQYELQTCIQIHQVFQRHHHYHCFTWGVFSSIQDTRQKTT